MEKSAVPQEKISALADGELEPGEFEAVLAGLRRSEGRKEWDLYHQIGDVLRSDDMAVDLSPDFAARMAARLEAEPVVFAPSAQSSNKTGSAGYPRNRNTKRYMVSGLAAVFAAFTAYLVAPQFMTEKNAAPTENFVLPALASVSSHATESAASASALAQTSAVASAAVDQEAVVLRDPNIDEYLLAHQRYSPSLYDTSQFVRSATFETDPQK